MAARGRILTEDAPPHPLCVPSPACVVVMSPQRGVFRAGGGVGVAGWSVFWEGGDGWGGRGGKSYWLVASSIIAAEPSAVTYTS